MKCAVHLSFQGVRFGTEVIVEASDHADAIAKAKAVATNPEGFIGYFTPLGVIAQSSVQLLSVESALEDERILTRKFEAGDSTKDSSLARAKFVDFTLSAYVRSNHTAGPYIPFSSEEIIGKSLIADVLADLRHWCHVNNVDFDGALHLSEAHFTEEVADELAVANELAA